MMFRYAGVRRARRIVAANRCPGARNSGVMHRWQFLGFWYRCRGCGVVA